jgi:hypothetical protein
MSESATSKELVNKLNRETAKIFWRDLQRFFAAGKVIVVNPSCDLINIAAAFAKDDAGFIEELMSSEQVSKVDDQQAASWYNDNTKVWAVVVSPWVLVQELGAKH